MRDSESLRSTKKQDIRSIFPKFKAQVVQLLDVYEGPVMKAATVEEATSQVSTFGKLLILKLLEFYPNLKDSFIESLMP